MARYTVSWHKLSREKLPMTTLLLVLISAVIVVIFRENQSADNSTEVKVFSKLKEINPGQNFRLITQDKKTPTTEQPQISFCLRVPIILYHHIQPMKAAQEKNETTLTVDVKNFESQVAYLVSSGYKTIPVEQLAQALIKRKKLPSKTAIITIDDGYRDIYTYAYPIAKKYNVILNLMIPTGLIGREGFLSWHQLQEMVNSGLVFAYNHTWSHASLGSLSRKRAEAEILLAKQQLTSKLGRDVNIFAYPYGSKSDVVLDILQSNGFIAGLTTSHGFNQCDTAIYTLHRN